MDKTTDINKLRRDIVFQASMRDYTLIFHSTWGIFSPKAIDKGTIMLLDYLEIEADHDCLDLGCGYGPIGLTMAKLAPQGQITMVDKDFMAIEYSRKNAEINHIHNCDIRLSNGLQHISEKRFHRIVSNMPAKVGSEMMTIILTDAYEQLYTGGRIYVVTITGLRRYIERNFKEIFGNYKKIKQGKQYTVAMATKEE